MLHDMRVLVLPVLHYIDIIHVVGRVGDPVSIPVKHVIESDKYNPYKRAWEFLAFWVKTYKKLPEVQQEMTELEKRYGIKKDGTGVNFHECPSCDGSIINSDVYRDDESILLYKCPMCNLLFGVKRR